MKMSLTKLCKMLGYLGLGILLLQGPRAAWGQNIGSCNQDPLKVCKDSCNHKAVAPGCSALLVKNCDCSAFHPAPHVGGAPKTPPAKGQSEVISITPAGGKNSGNFNIREKKVNFTDLSATPPCQQSRGQCNSACTYPDTGEDFKAADGTSAQNLCLSQDRVYMYGYARAFKLGTARAKVSQKKTTAKYTDPTVLKVEQSCGVALAKAADTCYPVIQ